MTDTRVFEVGTKVQKYSIQYARVGIISGTDRLTLLSQAHAPAQYSDTCIDSSAVIIFDILTTIAKSWRNTKFDSMVLSAMLKL